MKNPTGRQQAPPRLWADMGVRAKEMRKQPTPAEKLLWQALRGSRLVGLKFRRQHAIAGFIVDFYCVKANLVVEVDGLVHENQAETDDARQRLLEGRGLRVLRLTNEQVLNDLPSALQHIVKVCESPAGPPLSSQGEGQG